MAFGRDLFGEGPFGRADFSRKIIYESIPAEQRVQDQQIGRPLERVLSPLEQELDSEIERSMGLAKLRRPLEVRGSNVKKTMTVTAFVTEVDPDFGNVIVLTIGSSIPLEVEPSWTVELDGAIYSIVRIDSRDVVQTISVQGPLVPNVTVPAAYDFYETDVLKYLALDFGIDLDDNEPETLQRSVIKNVVKYLSWKGGVKGYEIRSIVAGFEAVVYSLYAITEGWYNSLPVAHRFSFAIGPEFRFYTDLDPIMLCWDDYPADLTYPPLEDCDEVVLYNDPAIGGDSPALEYATCIFQLNVTSVIAMNSGDLSTSGLASGWKITAMVAVPDYALINWTTSPPVFQIGDYFIEYVFSWDGVGTLVFAVSTIVAPATGLYCVNYSPRRVDNCNWCKSNVLAIQLTATAELIAYYSGNPAELARAEERLKQSLIAVTPVHVNVQYL